MNANESHYCFCLTATDLSPVDVQTMSGTKAALLRGAQWPAGSNIRVRFLEGAPELQERVKKVALEWVAPGMANLNLSFVNAGRADIRIAFKQGNGSWSYLGTVCRRIPEDRETMNFGWLTPESSEDELRRVVLHEFGHALGLIHEHQNPVGGIQWNRDAVIRDLSGPPNNWDAATIEENMFKKYGRKQVIATEADPDSIMMYPIPAAWTLDGFSAGLNAGLSPRDRSLIRSAYP